MAIASPLSTPKCVLVVDDDDGVREIVQISLEAAAGWEVLTAASGREAIAIATSHHPDAILLDVMMPGMDGAETFRHLQRDPETRDIPTIFLTAKAKASEREAYLALGVTGVITKPFAALSLVEDIRAILNWQL
ncbi:two-component system response regulator [Leptolyngbya valderiana BDU 20041]|nr:response regulator [Geitlerinema sp. CS-897]OAB63425.1 two-component system response regulator [Leptolyngbya valderiana BDU 20041]PPT07596.1 Response regulator receiver domain protein (CheY) [Geitlerinema sp. FC II]